MSRESWWLDFVEGELDSSTRAEMRSILRHSKKDQDIVRSLSDTKIILKENDSEKTNFPEDYLEQLHNQIMSQVETKEIKVAPKIKVKAYHKRWAKRASASLLLLVACFEVKNYLQHKTLNPHWEISRQMILQAEDNPLALTQLMTYQNESDFFVDVASMSLDHLTQEQFETLMKPTKTR